MVNDEDMRMAKEAQSSILKEYWHSRGPEKTAEKRIAELESALSDCKLRLVAALQPKNNSMKWKPRRSPRRLTSPSAAAAGKRRRPAEARRRSPRRRR